jgi:ribonuclease-3
MARRTSKRAVMEDAQLESMEALQAMLGHQFERPELLTLALTHRSWVYDSATTGPTGELADPSQDNEQLEFMGDAALGLLAAEALCRRFPGCREGELTRLRAAVVSSRHLGSVGTRLGLGRWMRLGHTAEKNAGRTNAALFANTMEALIAALYLDGGIEVARRFVEEEVVADALPGLELSMAENERFSGAVGDYKSELQELLQATGMGRPLYTVLRETGPEHRRIFRVEVRLAGDESRKGALAEAEGSTKKQAQQEAARLAVAKLTERKGGMVMSEAGHA